MNEKTIQDSMHRIEATLSRVEKRLDSERGAASRETEFRNLLTHAARELERTRGAFRSNRLKCLRERIEAALRE